MQNKPDAAQCYKRFAQPDEHVKSFALGAIDVIPMNKVQYIYKTQLLSLPNSCYTNDSLLIKFVTIPPRKIYECLREAIFPQIFVNRFITAETAAIKFT